MTWNDFLSAAAGGALLGLASGALWLATGRIAGVSGMVRNAVWGGEHQGRSNAAVFVLGLVAGGFLLRAFGLAGAALPGVAPAVMGAAGLSVGVGAAVANGCTSGHGLCGVGRLSMRSWVATVLFILSGAITVWVTR